MYTCVGRFVLTPASHVPSRMTLHACKSSGKLHQFAFSDASSDFLFSEKAGATGRSEGPGGGEVRSSLSLLQCP